MLSKSCIHVYLPEVYSLSTKFKAPMDQCGHTDSPNIKKASVTAPDEDQTGQLKLNFHLQPCPPSQKLHVAHQTRNNSIRTFQTTIRGLPSHKSDELDVVVDSDTRSSTYTAPAPRTALRVRLTSARFRIQLIKD